MTCYHRSKVLPTYSNIMTYVDIQCCLPLLIWLKTHVIIVPTRKPHIMLISSMCIIDRTLNIYFELFPQFNSIWKYE
jgi:hypothetical protein